MDLKRRNNHRSNIFSAACERNQIIPARPLALPTRTYTHHRFDALAKVENKDDNCSHRRQLDKYQAEKEISVAASCQAAFRNGLRYVLVDAK